MNEYIYIYIYIHLLLDDLKDSRGYCHLKEEALDRTMWRNRFGGGFGPVVRQTARRMNEHYEIEWTDKNKLSTHTQIFKQLTVMIHFRLKSVFNYPIIKTF